MKDDNEVPNNAVKAKDSKIVSDCRHLLKHPDNLIDGTKDPNVINQLKNANGTSNNSAVNPSIKANDIHTKVINKWLNNKVFIWIARASQYISNN